MYLVRVYEHNDNIISSESTYGGLNPHLFKCTKYILYIYCVYIQFVDIEHKLVDLLPCHVPACPCTKWTPQICTESSRVRKSRRHFVLLSKFWLLWLSFCQHIAMMRFLLLVRVSDYWLYWKFWAILLWITKAYSTSRVTLLFFYCSRKINRRVFKKNPLKNLRVMLKLNPYAKTARRRAILEHNPDVSSLMTKSLV